MVHLKKMWRLAANQITIWYQDQCRPELMAHDTLTYWQHSHESFMFCHNWWQPDHKVTEFPRKTHQKLSWYPVNNCQNCQILSKFPEYWECYDTGDNVTCHWELGNQCHENFSWKRYCTIGQHGMRFLIFIINWDKNLNF